MDINHTGMGDESQGGVVIHAKRHFQFSTGLQVHRERPDVPGLVGWPQWRLAVLLFYCPLLAEFPLQGIKWAASGVFCQKDGS